jgi:hypothetical protein
MKRRLLAVAGSALLLTSLSGYAAPEPTVTGDVDLEFGTAAADYSAGGALNIAAADGGKSTTGTVYSFGGLAGIQAEYVVSGLVIGETYLIQLPSSLNLVGTTSGQQITVDNLQSQPSASFVAASTEATILVGGTAQLAANQVGDTYTAPLSVTVTPQVPD